MLERRLGVEVTHPLPTVEGLRDVPVVRQMFRLGFPILAVFRLKGRPKRDAGIIFRSCEACQARVYPIRDAFAVVEYPSCPSQSSSCPLPLGSTRIEDKVTPWLRICPAIRVLGTSAVAKPCRGQSSRRSPGSHSISRASQPEVVHGLCHRQHGARKRRPGVGHCG